MLCLVHKGSRAKLGETQEFGSDASHAVGEILTGADVLASDCMGDYEGRRLDVKKPICLGLVVLCSL